MTPRYATLLGRFGKPAHNAIVTPDAFLVVRAVEMVEAPTIVLAAGVTRG